MLVANVTIARPSAPHRSFPNPLPVLAIALLVAAIAGAGLLVRSPTFVHHVDIDNPGAVDVNVAVQPADGSGRLLLGTVPAGGSLSVQDVVDQGSTWVFSFTYGERDGGTARVTRAVPPSRSP